MLALVIFLVFIDGSYAVASENIKTCAKMVGGVVRPEIPPNRCNDADFAACFALFEPLDVLGDLATYFNPKLDYKVNKACNDMLDVASKSCPYSCAMCCKAPAFSCTNDAKTDCSPFDNDFALCTSPLAKNIAGPKCPRSCGMCGSGAVCPDLDVNCAQAKILAGCDTDIMKIRCMGTCNLMTCLPTTAAPCADTANNCAQVKSAGFCNSTVLPQQELQRCRSTCGFC